MVISLIENLLFSIPLTNLGQSSSSDMIFAFCGISKFLFCCFFYFYPFTCPFDPFPFTFIVYD